MKNTTVSTIGRRESNAHRSAPSTRPRFVTSSILVLVLALASLVGSAAPATAQNAIGLVVQSWGDVRGSLASSAPAQLSTGDDLFLNHRIETGTASGARMKLGENGAVRIGPESELTLDQAAIDQATGREQNLWSLLVGKIEVALGSLFRGDVTIDTPSAELGVKGTVFRVLVDSVGNTYVAVLEGTVEVRSKTSDAYAELTRGFWTRIDVGADPLPPRPFDANPDGLSPTTGGPDFSVPGEDPTGDPPIGDGNFEIDPPRQPPSISPNQGQGQGQDQGRSLEDPP